MVMGDMKVIARREDGVHLIAQMHTRRDNRQITIMHPKGHRMGCFWEGKTAISVDATFPETVRAAMVGMEVSKIIDLEGLVFPTNARIDWATDYGPAQGTGLFLDRPITARGLS